MKQTKITLTDDLTGKEIEDGQGETIPFMFEGKMYEIDLNKRNSAQFRKTMSRYAGAARTVRATKNGRAARPQRSGKTAEIRAWATAHGYEVGHRGRIPANIVEAYEAAN